MGLRRQGAPPARPLLPPSWRRCGWVGAVGAAGGWVRWVRRVGGAGARSIPRAAPGCASRAGAAAHERFTHLTD